MYSVVLDIWSAPAQCCKDERLTNHKFPSTIRPRHSLSRLSLAPHIAAALSSVLQTGCVDYLIEGGLLHDAKELLLVDFVVAITISLVNHFLQLLVSHGLSELLCDALQVLE